MENKQLLGKIKSYYLLNQIFNYIQNENLKLKLFKYSKLYQEKLGIKLFEYKEKYLQKIGFILNRYLFKDEESNKDTLNTRLQKFLNKRKLTNNEIENIVFDIFSNKKEKDLDEEDIITLDECRDTIISVYSPFFDVISKTENFQKKYSIPILEKNINKYNLKDDYRRIFEKLNELNIKYFSINFIFSDNNSINYLKDFNIDFNKIKRLTIVQEDIINKNDKYLFKTIFSFNNIENTLIYLKLYLEEEKNFKTDSESFEGINNFKSLRYLYISYFDFDKTFLFKLKTLKLLSFEKVKNINISQDCCSNLKRFTLSDTIVNSESLFKLPKLECGYFFDYYIEYHSIVDFKSLTSLKSFTGKLNDFFKLESEILEDITLNTYIENKDKNEEIKIIEKIINLKKLKIISFGLFQINDNDISKIEGENISIISLKLYWGKNKEKCILSNLQSKFPNLTEIEIINKNLNDNSLDIFKKTMINIKENQNCKIYKIHLDIKNSNDLIQFNCGPFEKLVVIKFIFHPDIYNLENTFPLFSKNCEIIFKSLKIFYFQFKYVSIFENHFLNILENIYNNLDKMPNLKEFLLDCTCKVSEEFYIKFLKKILSMNLNYIYFNIKNNENNNNDGYSVTEIKNIYKSFDFYQYKSIFIKKK